MYRSDRGSALSHLAAQFTHDWMKQKHGETLSSLLLLSWKGDSFLTCPTHLAGTVISAFPVQAHPWLMSLWSRLRNDPERPASATLLLGAGGSLQGPAGPWPSPWLWMGVQQKARYTPSGSNTRLRSCLPSRLCCTLKHKWMCLFFSSVRSLI